MTAFDPGLQPERTALAWRRTALAVTVWLLGAGRLVAASSGAVAALLGTGGVALGLGLVLVAQRRAAVVDRALRADADLRNGPGARLLATLAALALLIAIAGLVVAVAAR